MSESQQGPEICDVISRKRYYHIILTMKIDSVQITSVRKAGLTIYASLVLEAQKSVRCPY